MAGFENQVLLCDNVNFNTGLPKPHLGLMTLDGQLIIGSTALNAGGTHLNINTLTAGAGVSIVNGPGTITISLAGGSTGVDSFTTDLNGPVLPDGGGNVNFTGGQIFSNGSIANTVRLALAGTNHGIFIGQGALTNATLVGPSATAGQVLQSAGAAADPAFSTATYPATTTINQLLYSSAANVVSGLTAANSAMLVSTSTGVPVWSGTLTNGQMIIGSTGATPAAGTITSTGGTITVTLGAGTLNIDTNGSTVGNTITGDTGGALSPTAGNWNILGQQAGTVPVVDTIGSGSTLNIEDRTWLTTLVVDTSSTVGLRGTYTTLASAMAAAVSGQTIFLRTSVTENVTLTPGVNIFALPGAHQTPEVSITGKLTMTAAGSVTISNIRLTTNSDYFLVVSGVAASIVNLENCYLNVLNASGINVTSTLGSVNIRFCTGDVKTTGITLYVSTVGGVSIYNTTIGNSGNTITAASASAGIIFMSYSLLYLPLTFTSTGSLQAYQTTLLPGTKVILTSGTGSVTLDKCTLGGGTETVATAGVGTTIIFNDCSISSSNAAVIDGAGTVVYSNISFVGTSAAMTTTTQAIRRTSNDGIVVKTPGAYPYTTMPQDALILVDSSSARSIVPYAAPLEGQRHIIKDNVGSAAANNITVTPSGKNIDGAASYTMNTNYGSITIVYNGAQWNVT